MRDEAFLRGFVGHPSDLRDRLRLCRPLVSLEPQGPSILLTRELDWEIGTRSVKSVDQREVSRFGTLLDNGPLGVSSGLGVAVMGTELVEAVVVAGLDDVGGLVFTPALGCDFRIAVCSRQRFERYVAKLVTEAKAVFDDQLRKSGHATLSEAGVGALFVLRRAPLRQDPGVVLRRLAGAYARRDKPKVYADLLAYFAHDLNRRQDALDKDVRAYLARQFWTTRLPMRTYGGVYEHSPLRCVNVLEELVEFHTYAVPLESWPSDERIILSCEHGIKDSYMHEHVYAAVEGKELLGNLRISSHGID